MTTETHIVHPEHLNRFGAWIVTIALMLLVTGCDDPPKTSGLPRISPGTTRHVPGDRDTVYTSGSRPGEVAEPVNGEADNARRTYAVDAMVGQINGKPIYASEVFEEVGEEQLAALARSNPPEQFRNEASFLLGEKLREMITDSLILAEAEGSLTEQEQMGLLEVLRQFREDLISQHQGSEVLTEEYMQRERNISLDEAVEQHRQRILTQRFLQQKLNPRVHVTRRQVERFYEDHYDQFNPSGRVAVAIITTDDPTQAAQVQQRLDAGQSFEEAGKVPGVRYRERLEYKTDLKDFDEFPDEVDARVRRLAEGEHTGRIDTDRFVYFVKLLETDPAEGKRLEQVFLQIESHLRNREFDKLNRQYLQELFEKGNFTPLNQMMRSLLTVATNRYVPTG